SSLVRKMRFPLGLAQQTDLPSAHSKVERAKTKSTAVTKFLKKMAKESISRFVSPEESGVAPQKFKSRRQLLPQPVAGCEFAKQSGRQDSNLRHHGPKPCALAKLSYAPKKSRRSRIENRGSTIPMCPLW